MQHQVFPINNRICWQLLVRWLKADFWQGRGTTLGTNRSVKKSAFYCKSDTLLMIQMTMSQRTFFTAYMKSVTALNTEIQNIWDIFWEPHWQFRSHRINAGNHVLTNSFVTDFDDRNGKGNTTEISMSRNLDLLGKAEETPLHCREQGCYLISEVIQVLFLRAARSHLDLPCHKQMGLCASASWDERKGTVTAQQSQWHLVRFLLSHGSICMELRDEAAPRPHKVSSNMHAHTATCQQHVHSRLCGGLEVSRSWEERVSCLPQKYETTQHSATCFNEKLPSNLH